MARNRLERNVLLSSDNSFSFFRVIRALTPSEDGYRIQPEQRSPTSREGSQFRRYINHNKRLRGRRTFLVGASLEQAARASVPGGTGEDRGEPARTVTRTRPARFGRTPAALQGHVGGVCAPAGSSPPAHCRTGLSGARVENPARHYWRLH